MTPAEDDQMTGEQAVFPPRKSWAPALLAIAYALMITAWVFGNSPGAAADENSHYLRAIGAGRGEFAPGTPRPPLGAEDRNKVYLRWQQRQVRMIEVTGALSPSRFDCPEMTETGQWVCEPEEAGSQELVSLPTAVGTYPPYSYVLPGLAMQAADDAVTALLAGRAVSAALAAALIAVAVFLVWDPRVGWLAFVGLTAAVTPMVVFVSSSLSASGPEIAAGLAFGAAVLRLGRDDPGNRTGVIWAAAAFSGSVLAVTRDLGVGWVFGIVVAGLLLGRFGNYKKAFSGAPRAASFSIAAVVLAVAAAAAWQLMVQVRPETDFGRLVSDLTSSLRAVREIMRQSIGVFGSLSTVLPDEIYIAWSMVLIALGLLAMWAATGRQRLALLATGAAAVLAILLVDAVQRQVEFGVQARHILPFAVMAPLVAGEILIRRSQRVRALRFALPALGLSVGAGLMLAASWYVNGLVRTTGFGTPFPFWTKAGSAPPGGWTVWAATAAAGSVLMMASGAVAALSGLRVKALDQ